MNLAQLRATVEGRLIVSCQAAAGHPLRHAGTLVRVARAAVDGGAAAIRCGGAGGAGDVAAIAAAIDVPVIGLTKDGDRGVYITPTVTAALAIVAAGADVVAGDATDRPRPDGSRFADLVEAVHAGGRLVMADVSTVGEGLAAAEAGADLVATTLSGYTSSGPPPKHPDIALVAALRSALADRIIVAEGRYHSPRSAAAARAAGATAVVVGTAITDPTWITARFADALTGSAADAHR